MGRRHGEVLEVSLLKCNPEVMEHGVSLGFFDMPKEKAEQYCKDETKRTGRLHDWHYVGGRVHIKALLDVQTEPFVIDGGTYGKLGRPSALYDFKIGAMRSYNPKG